MRAQSRTAVVLGRRAAGTLRESVPVGLGRAEAAEVSSRWAVTAVPWAAALAELAGVSRAALLVRARSPVLLQRRLVPFVLITLTSRQGAQLIPSSGHSQQPSTTSSSRRATPFIRKSPEPHATRASA